MHHAQDSDVYQAAEHSWEDPKERQLALRRQRRLRLIENVEAVLEAVLEQRQERFAVRLGLQGIAAIHRKRVAGRFQPRREVVERFGAEEESGGGSLAPLEVEGSAQRVPIGALLAPLARPTPSDVPGADQHERGDEQESGNEHKRTWTPPHAQQAETEMTTFPPTRVHEESSWESDPSDPEEGPKDREQQDPQQRNRRKPMHHAELLR